MERTGETSPSRGALRLHEKAKKQQEERLERARWSKRHSGSVCAELRRRGQEKRAERLEACSSWLLFREFVDYGKVVLRAADFCQQRKLCPGCAAAAARRTTGAAVGKVVALLERDELIPVMVTLTQRTGPSLTERYEHLFAALKRLNQRRRDHLRGKCDSALGRASAAIWHAEVKRGRKATWHAHLHGLVLLPFGSFIDFPKLCSEWAACVRQDVANVDVRMTGAGRRMLREDLPFDRLLSQDQAVIVDDLTEVLKYPLKFGSKMSAADVVDVHQITHRRHAMRTWGDLIGVKEQEAGGALDSFDGPYLDRFFRWHNGAYLHVATFAGNTDEEHPAA